MNNIIIPANSIAVLYLENMSLFLYPALCAYESEAELILECAMYYDYVKKYKPIRIADVIYDKSIHELDQLLIHYMLLYGQDYVRGGNYYEEVLPEYKKQMLQDLLDFNYTDELSNINPLRKIIEKYKNINVEEIPEKIENLNKTFEKYKKEFENLENFRYVKNGSKTYNIDSSIFIDIEWIRTFCNNNTNLMDDSMVFSLQNKQIYKRVIVLFKKLTELYLPFNDMLTHAPAHLVYLKNPEFLFDKFVYHFQTCKIGQDDLTMVNIICDKFKYISCFLLNRIDEFLFDVYKSYGYECKADWIIPREIFYLNHMLEKNQTPLNENGKNPDVEVGL